MGRDPRVDPCAGDVLKDEFRALWKVEAISPNGVVHVRHRGRPDCFTMDRWRRHAADFRPVPLDK